MSLESIIVNLSYLGILLMMVTNGIMSLPSSQFLYIIAGYFVSTGFLNLWLVLIAGTIGNTIGCIILYELTRKHGINYVMKFNLFPKKEIKKVQMAFSKKGIWFLFVAKLLPALKVFVPVAAGIAKVNRILYAGIIILSSFIWACIFVAIGYVFGKSTEVFKTYAPLLLLVAFFVMWLFYKYMNSEEVIQAVQKSR